MAKYRPIDMRLWSDRKFLALGDDARMLWMYLLTSPSTISIPGVIIAGEGAMSEHLGWTVERFRTRISEIERSGVSIRREGRLTWLPNALRYQKPSNPNAVKSWAKTWDDVPEGALKLELWQALKVACKSWSGLFAKGFAQPFEDGSANGYVNRSTQDQEQDQEQKQDQEQEQDLGRGAAPPLHQIEPLRLTASEPSKRQRKQPARAMPSGWSPNATACSKAHDLKLDVRREAEQFKLHHESKGSVFASWDAAFLTWLGNALRFTSGSYAPKQGPTAHVLEMLGEAEERERRGIRSADPFADVPHAAEAAS